MLPHCTPSLSAVPRKGFGRSECYYNNEWNLLLSCINNSWAPQSVATRTAQKPKRWVQPEGECRLRTWVGLANWAAEREINDVEIAGLPV